MTNVARLVKDPEKLADWVTRTALAGLRKTEPLTAPTVVRGVDSDPRYREEYPTLTIELNSCSITVTEFEPLYSYAVTVTRIGAGEAGRCEYEDGDRTPGCKLYRCLEKIEQAQLAAWAEQMVPEIEGLGA